MAGSMRVARVAVGHGLRALYGEDRVPLRCCLCVDWVLTVDLIADLV